MLIIIIACFIISTKTTTTSSTRSRCRQEIKIKNGNGDIEHYVLREDAKEANHGMCDGDCYYKRIGDEESYEGQMWGYCMRESQCDSCYTGPEIGCKDPKEIRNGEYKCDKEKFENIEKESLYPVNTKCTAKCENGFIGSHEIQCTQFTSKNVTWEPPEKPNICEVTHNCLKNILEQISETSLKCTLDSNPITDNSHTPLRSECIPECSKTEVDLSVTRFSKVFCVKCSEQPPLTEEKCGNTSWADKNKDSFELEDMRGICNTCKEPEPVKDAFWKCNKDPLNNGEYPHNTTCQLKCKNSQLTEIQTHVSIVCEYDPDTAENRWEYLNDTTKEVKFADLDEKCSSITILKIPVAKCECIDTGKCTHKLKAEDLKVDAYVYNRVPPNGIKSPGTIKENSTNGEFFIDLHLSPGDWVIHLQGKNIFPIWRDLDVPVTDGVVEVNLEQIKLDCSTILKWDIVDDTTGAPIEPGHLVCKRTSGVDGVDVDTLEDQCDLMHLMECVKDCEESQTETKENCLFDCRRTHNINPGINPDTCKKKSLADPSGALQNFFFDHNIRAHNWDEDPDPRPHEDHILVSGDNYTCHVDMTEMHTLPDNDAKQDFKSLTPKLEEESETFKVKRRFAIEVKVEEFDSFDFGGGFLDTPGLDKESVNRQKRQIERAQNRFTGTELESLDLKFNEEYQIKNEDGIYNNFLKFGQNQDIESEQELGWTKGTYYLRKTHQLQGTDRFELTDLFCARWNLELVKDERLEKEVGNGYLEFGSQVEGKTVKNFWSEKELIQVGDPYYYYNRLKIDVPDIIIHKLVPMINVYVQVYDESCFNLCDDDDKGCTLRQCKPLDKRQAEVTVTKEVSIEGDILPDELDSLKDKAFNVHDFKNYSEKIGLGENTHVKVKYPGHHKITCKPEEKDNFQLNSNKDRVIRENLLVTCFLLDELGRAESKRFKQLDERKQTEIMKLALDWSAPNPLVPSDLDLHFVMFNTDGEGVCSSYNSRKSNCPNEGEGEESDPNWDCEKMEANENGGKFAYRINDRCCDKDDNEFWKCKQTKKGKENNNFGPETAIIPNTAIAEKKVSHMMLFVLNKERKGEESTRISNAQLDITLQYKAPGQFKDKITNVYLKKDDMGMGKSGGNVYLAACIKFNENGDVEEMVRPINSWLHLPRKFYAMQFLNKKQEQGPNFLECWKCFPLFCGTSMKTPVLTEEEKFYCCECKNEMNDFLRKGKTEFGYEKTAEVACPSAWEGVLSRQGQKCRC